MAYQFVAASSQRIHGASFSTFNPPLTLHARFNKNGSATQAIVSLDNATGGTEQRHVIETVVTTDVIVARSNANAASSSTSFALSTWASGAGVYSSQTNRVAYLDGVAGTANTTNAGVSFDNINIGARRTSALGLYFSGDIAEVAVWNVALTADEVQSLAVGFKPFRIRPQSLKFYAPLVRDIVDLKAALALTNANAATVTTHPRVY